jgi:hypothetical protein
MLPELRLEMKPELAHLGHTTGRRRPIRAGKGRPLPHTPELRYSRPALDTRGSDPADPYSITYRCLARRRQFWPATGRLRGVLSIFVTLSLPNTRPAGSARQVVLRN